MDSLLWALLAYACLPAWLIAGLVDYWSQQQSDIAHTTGPRESVLHLAQAIQVGVPVLLMLFFELTLLTLAVAAALALLHTATAYWDLWYTSPRRRIPAVEQMAYAFLITLPLFVTAILAVLAWPQIIAIGAPTAAPVAAALQLRQAPWDPLLVTVILGSSLLFGLLPALAELRQSVRAARRG